MIDVKEFSKERGEPIWMRRLRVKALRKFYELEEPEGIKVNYEELEYYTPHQKVGSLEEVPKEVRKVFDKLGLPEFERKMLAGISLQTDSTVIYEDALRKFEEKGVIVEDMDVAIKKYGWLKDYFMKLIPYDLHKFAALHTALWSGGVLVRVPKGVKVDLPIQAFILINRGKISQFEHNIIIAEEGSKVHFIEGCSAPVFSKVSIHSGMEEVYVGKNANVQITTLQNWTRNVKNYPTKRYLVEERGRLRLLLAMLGSKHTVLYPTTILKGKNASVECLGISFVDGKRAVETGASVVHLGKGTRSKLVSRSVVKDEGISKFKGKIKVVKGAKDSVGFMKCDSLLLSKKAKSETIPQLYTEEESVELNHEARTGRIGEEELFYLRSRGFEEDEAISLLVNGFFEPIMRNIPFEYAIEIRKLIELSIKGL